MHFKFSKISFFLFNCRDMENLKIVPGPRQDLEELPYRPNGLILKDNGRHGHVHTGCDGDARTEYPKICLIPLI